MIDKKISIVAICGSLRKNSFTKKALTTVLKGSQEVGAETKLISLSEYNLIFCNGDSKDSDLPADVLKLRKEVKEADGILLGTPEYHGSYTGVLKNALDLMGFDEFEGKMIGLVGVSGGAMGALDALNSLRVVGRSLHSWVIPEQVSIPFVNKVFDSEGNVLNERIEQRLISLGKQLARFSYLHSSEESKAFIKAWESAPNNPGADK